MSLCVWIIFTSIIPSCHTSCHLSSSHPLQVYNANSQHHSLKQQASHMWTLGEHTQPISKPQQWHWIEWFSHQILGFYPACFNLPGESLAELAWLLPGANDSPQRRAPSTGSWCICKPCLPSLHTGLSSPPTGLSIHLKHIFLSVFSYVVVDFCRRVPNSP